MRTSARCILPVLLFVLACARAASPTVTPIDPPDSGYTLGASPSLKFSIMSSTSIVTLAVVVDGSVSTATYDANTATWSAATANLSHGAHCYTVTAIDANNNPGSRKVNFTNDRSDPAITISSPASGGIAVGAPVHFTGTFSGLYNHQVGSIAVRVGGIGGPTYSADSIVWNDEHSGTYSAWAPLDTPGWNWVDAIIASPGGKKAQTGQNINVYFLDFYLENSTNGYTCVSGEIAGTYFSDGSYWLNSLWLQNQASMDTYGYWSDGVGNYGNNVVHFLEYANDGPPPAGTYTVNIQFTNSNGDTFLMQQYITVDATGPECAYVEPSAANGVVFGTQAILSISDSGSGVGLVDLRLTSNMDESVPFSSIGDGIELDNLANGDYDLTVLAWDNVGNLSSFRWLFTIDANKPTFTNVTSPIYISAAALAEGAQILFANWQAAEPYSVDSQSLQVDASSPAINVTVLENGFSVTLDQNASLSEGQFTISATIADDLGLSSDPLSVTYIVDLTPPEFTPVTPPNSNTPLTGGIARMDVTDMLGWTVQSVGAYDENDILHDIPFNFDGQGINIFPTVVTGQQEFHITAVDDAGNVGVTIWTVELDRLLPAVTFNSPADNTYVYNPNPRITGVITKSPGGPFDPESFFVWVTDADDVFQGVGYTVNPGDGTFALDATDLPEGAYTIVAEYADIFGNVSEQATWHIKVDRTLGCAKLVTPLAGLSGFPTTTDQRGTLEVGFADTALDGNNGSGIDPMSVTAQIDGNAISLPIVSATGFTYEPNNDWTFGWHYMHIAMADNSGNLSDDDLCFYVTSNSDITPPQISIIGPPPQSCQRINNPIIELAIQDDGSGIDLGSIEVKLDSVSMPIIGGIVAENNNDGSVKKTTIVCWFDSAAWPEYAYLDEGEHGLSVTVFDNAGNQGLINDWPLKIDTTPPMLTFDLPGNSGTVFSTDSFISFTASDNISGVNPSTIKAKIDGRSASSTFDAGSITVHAQNLEQGAHTIVISLNDCAEDWQNPASLGNYNEQTFTFNVDRQTLVVSLFPDYGYLPVIWHAEAYLDGENVSSQCTFTWLTSLPQVTTSGNHCEIPASSDSGFWSISVSASIETDGGGDAESGTETASVQIPDDDGDDDPPRIGRRPIDYSTQPTVTITFLNAPGDTDKILATAAINLQAEIKPYPGKGHWHWRHDKDGTFTQRVPGPDNTSIDKVTWTSPDDPSTWQEDLLYAFYDTEDGMSYGANKKLLITKPDHCVTKPGAHVPMGGAKFNGNGGPFTIPPSKIDFYIYDQFDNLIKKSYYGTAPAQRYISYKEKADWVRGTQRAIQWSKDNIRNIKTEWEAITGGHFTDSYFYKKDFVPQTYLWHKINGHRLLIPELRGPLGNFLFDIRPDAWHVAISDKPTGGSTIHEKRVARYHTYLTVADIQLSATDEAGNPTGNDNANVECWFVLFND